MNCKQKHFNGSYYCVENRTYAEAEDSLSRSELNSIENDNPAVWELIADMKERDQGKGPKPIPMVLHCPRCGAQHIDEEETEAEFLLRWKEVAEYERLTGEKTGTALERWTNPPHKSHLCHNCGTIWRVADIPTNGVKTVGVGEKDTWKPS